MSELCVEYMCEICVAHVYEPSGWNFYSLILPYLTELKYFESKIYIQKNLHSNQYINMHLSIILITYTHWRLGNSKIHDMCIQF